MKLTFRSSLCQTQVLCFTEGHKRGPNKGETRMGLFDKKNSTNTHIAKVKQVLDAAMPDLEWIEDGPGNWGNRNESVMVRVMVDTESNADAPNVAVVAFTLINARDDDALYRHLMREESYPFNKWEVEASDEKGKVNIYLVTRMLIADLDPAELQNAIMTTAIIADNVDEDLQKRFGGQRCLDHFGWEE